MFVTVLPLCFRVEQVAIILRYTRKERLSNMQKRRVGVSRQKFVSISTGIGLVRS